ncbi:DUF2238 domain-containing protein [Clostridium sp. C2-6-12]|uniref:DUF2238 domain-containing protein n=1 Tax=Clostridium sp. C2-6-12 TaxID=2698832 RepID=UPI00136A7714|nr:DUF2238 domain-containing protein [Clostridium sp. C2-6-12]
MRKEFFNKILIISISIILILSAVNCHDLFTWFLEVLPVIIAEIVLVVTYKKFKFTSFTYMIIWIHALILIVGGHYTYAEMPLFNWLKDIFHLSRNYYDRVGHLAQGFVPAIVIREVFIRNKMIKNKAWTNFIVISICLAISASYELIEFAVAMITGEAADAFLGTQGDVWDTQWDMTCALIGSIFSIILLSKYQYKILEKL